MTWPGPAAMRSGACRSRSPLPTQEQFRAWCAAQPPVPWPGQIILAGLAPLPAAEIRWGLFAHTQRERHTRWDAGWVQALVNTCRARGTGSLTELDLSSCTTFAAMVGPGDAARPAAGLLHPGSQPGRGLHRDRPLRGAVPRTGQPLRPDRHRPAVAARPAVGLPGRPAALPGCPRTGGTFDAFRRAATELGAFLAVDAPGGGHDPAR